MGLIRTGHGLWSQLVERAALDLRRYDKDVATDFRKNLKLPENGSIIERLKELKVRPEPVLGGFFKSVQPFTHMFRDILSLVECAGKSVGKENLRVQFDFEEGKKLELDLESFREQVEQFSSGVRPLSVERWSLNRLWNLCYALGKHVEPPDAGVRRWSEEYGGGRWPARDLDPPRFGDADLDELVERAWQVRRAAIEAARDFSPNPSDLRPLTSEQREDLIIEGGLPSASRGGMSTVASLHSDQWSVSFASRAYARAAESRSDPALVERLRQNLRAVLNDPPPELRDFKVAVRDVEEILRLPIWQRRYDLYSVWVLTQIVAALGGPTNFKFELEGDAFHIPFAPTLLATALDSRMPVRIWGEVRYGLSSPTGKGRVSGMQPDYSLTLDTRKPPEEAFAIVECKQYMRASAKNFGAALTDYATGQPGASVVLVNYGTVGASVLKRVPAPLLPRVKSIGVVRPLQDDSISEFHDWVREQVDRQPVAAEEEPPPTAEHATVTAPRTLCGDDFACIELRWGAAPRDLDLYFFVPATGGRWEVVNFMWDGALDAWPWARLSGDVQTGGGPEVIRISRPLPGSYRIFVKRYSNDAPLAGSGASLTIYTSAASARRFVCPATGDGAWWHVCDVDFLASVVTEVNLISDSTFVGGPV
jgi:hypothetical protein